MTVGNIIKANGHQDSHITMMKMDTEGAELKGIKVWLDEGALDNVHQFALEYHLGIFYILSNLHEYLYSP